ncbi:lipopolysaccharide biosynthesis protein [Williamwhitmania taraxaci]|uniref:Membrane protein involved in the export of O-antigen and teichoic acid n=1 Tax=Williamwhitmania taraxaci TaxID=1640674 RepID=A0A1G6GXT7_9BACT|nr:polysaccharide biosynthesis C-terminal domain-containing protein [Williamwhitmania taraxaci]SDB86733.1 Membrane protein involved in the export of O-antigen and teichoic acid [Williamwhitmania taraxaci]
MESNSSLFKKLFGHAALYGISSVGGRFINYLLVPFHTRIFNPEAYGVITDFYAQIAVLLIFLTLGLETGFFRFTSKGVSPKEVFNNSFLILLANGLIFLLAVFLFLPSISSALGYSHFPEYVLIFALILFFDTLVAIPFSKLRLEGRALEFALVKSGSIFVNVGLNWLFLTNTFFINSIHRIPFLENTGLVFLVFLSNFVASLLTLGYFYRDFFSIRFKVNLALIKKIVFYSFPLMVGGFAGIVNDMADRFFIKGLVPAEQNPMYQLGIYGGILKISILLNLFIQVYRFAAEPLFFKNSENAGSKKFFADSTKFFFVISLLIFLFISFYLSYFQMILGGDYRVGIGIVPILLLSYVFYGFYFNISVWFKLTDKTKYAVVFTLFGLAINALINYYTVPIYGFWGSAWARLASYFLMVVSCYFVGQRFFKVDYDLRNMFLYLTFSLSLYFFDFFLLAENSITTFFTKLLLLFLFIALFLWREKELRYKLNSIIKTYGSKGNK